MALRLLCMDVGEAHEPDTHATKRPRTEHTYTRHGAERVWRAVAHGQREHITAANESAVREKVAQLCSGIEQSHSARLAKLEDEAGDSAHAIKSLLLEEQRIAVRVKAAAQRGDAW